MLSRSVSATAGQAGGQASMRIGTPPASAQVLKAGWVAVSHVCRVLGGAAVACRS